MNAQEEAKMKAMIEEENRQREACKAEIDAMYLGSVDGVNCFVFPDEKNLSSVEVYAGYMVVLGDSSGLRTPFLSAAKHQGKSTTHKKEMKFRKMWVCPDPTNIPPTPDGDNPEVMATIRWTEDVNGTLRENGLMFYDNDEMEWEE